MCNEKAEYMINLLFDDLDNSESISKAGWYCGEHIVSQTDSFLQQMFNHVKENQTS